MTTTIGAFLSVVIGIFFYFRTDLKAALAVFAGLLGIAIALQLELLYQNRRAVAASTSRERIANQIEATDWLPKIIGESLDALQSIRGGDYPPVVMDLARMEFEYCRGRLRDLQRGFIDERRFTEVALTDLLTIRTVRELRATSGKSELGWWLGPDANVYLQRQAEALGRGVKIERIFIYENWTKLHDEVCARQRGMGIDIFRVQEKKISSVRNPELIIWDEMCGFAFEFNSRGDLVNARFSFEPAAIRGLASSFAAIRSVAEMYSPAATP